jgi:hypothetical protein
VRLVARQDVVSDGVSEAGVPAANIAASLGKLYDVELVTFADAETFDWDARCRRTAASRCWPRPRAAATARNARAGWRPDLHLALWNPYQALDFAAPALMTYGFAPPALEAVNAWLPGIWLGILFILLFRAGGRAGPDHRPAVPARRRAIGGLGLSTQEVGAIYGTAGTAAFLVGSILGGYFTSWIGLKRAMPFLILAMNVPNLVFYYLSMAQPDRWAW